MRTNSEAKALSVATAAVGMTAALMLTAAPALADPEIPTPPPPPPPGQTVSVHAADGVPAPPAEVPHLPSPENLPPGTTDTPVGPQRGRGVEYLRDLWHAVQTQEISGGDALLLLTQRRLDPNAAPPPGVAPGPPGPVPPPPPAP
ncbi:MAG: dopamine receptor D4 [Mycobacterium sp.]